MSQEGGLTRSDAFDQRLALLVQMKFNGQRGIEVRHLGAGIEQKVVGTSVVDRYREDCLVAVDQDAGQTGDISRAVGLCREHRKKGCGKNKGNKNLESRHCECSSAG